MKTRPLRIATILGTRPEIIRLSCVIRLLDESVEHHLIHTGQSYDHALSEVFFEDLELRPPDHFLKVEVGTVGAVYGNVLIATEKVLKEVRPDAVLVLGDTNSALSAIIAKRMHIPVYHMEAGNRCFDFNVPEEVNRRIVDHISDFNLVYTERARQHLLAEGLPPRRIYLTGSPLKEVLTRHSEGIEASRVLHALGLEPGQFFLASAHREENVDDPRRIGAVVEALNLLAETYKLPIVMSTHPRTRQRLEELSSTPNPRISFVEPFGFLDYVKLQKNALCVISDSGSIAEEASILGFPAVTLRDSMERPEALDAGSIGMAPLEPPHALLESVQGRIAAFRRRGRPPIPVEYQISDTSERVLNLILATARLSNKWEGVRPQRP